jgi:hypothetical protein
MRRIDELHLEFPFAGSRMLRDLLRGGSENLDRCDEWSFCLTAARMAAEQERR